MYILALDIFTNYVFDDTSSFFLLCCQYVLRHLLIASIYTIQTIKNNSNLVHSTHCNLDFNLLLSYPDLNEISLVCKYDYVLIP